MPDRGAAEAAAAAAAAAARASRRWHTRRPPRPAPAQVEINGRAMHIGRPKGYVPPAPGEKVPPAGTSAAGALPAAAPIAVVGGVPTVVLLLSGILPAGQLRTEAERRVVSMAPALRAAGLLGRTGEPVGQPAGQGGRRLARPRRLCALVTAPCSLIPPHSLSLPSHSPPPPPPTHPPAPCPQLQEEVYEEASRYGQVGGVYVASPTAAVQDLMPGRCYVKYGSPEDAAKGGRDALGGPGARGGDGWGWWG